MPARSKGHRNRTNDIYVRNRDVGKFKHEDTRKDHGVILTKYYGTVSNAMRKGVPLYNRNGSLHSTPGTKRGSK
jgi:hypothetical protein